MPFAFFQHHPVVEDAQRDGVYRLAQTGQKRRRISQEVDDNGRLELDVGQSGSRKALSERYISPY